jgi:RHS repeat-associated protein
MVSMEILSEVGTDLETADGESLDARPVASYRKCYNGFRPSVLDDIRSAHDESLSMTARLEPVDQRFYASAYGRFNTPDPAGGSADPGNPGSLNRYAYATGDPINFNDPSGLFPCGSTSVSSNGQGGFSTTTYECTTFLASLCPLTRYNPSATGH